MVTIQDMTLGANYLGDGRAEFLLWAPYHDKVDLHLHGEAERLVELRPDGKGYHQATAEDIWPGARYTFKLGAGKDRPDPASRYQPDGVHGPSQVVDPIFGWLDSNWRGLPLQNYLIYELHVGTFTAEGTFAAIIPRLTELQELGITAIELMPVAQFPGSRNWGYDCVQPFAVQNSYGGVAELKQLVDACHQRGMAVILDVVYNHFGPEGNYLGEFAPYFTDRYKTPWGPALNFDGPESDHVRRFFIENALFWVAEFHFDALRLDAVHAILDHSPYTFLEQLGHEVHEKARALDRQIFLIPESAANDSRLIRQRERGGYGLDAQWNDDFHHSLRALLAGESSGYYQDFGELHQLVKAYREGFVYSGEYSKYRRRRHGTSTKDVPAERFVVFAQNHDQIGNRMLGERLTRLVSFEALKLAAGAVILSPYIPLLFMGEEYGEQAPFQYFISHSDSGLIAAVRDGRRREFAAFGWRTEPPDPQDEGTFLRSKLNHQLKRDGKFRTLWDFYRELIDLRKRLPPLAQLSKEQCDVLGFERERALVLRRWKGDDAVVALFNFNDEPVALTLSLARGRWHKGLDSADPRWQGAGSLLPAQLDAEKSGEIRLQPKSIALFIRLRDDRANSSPTDENGEALSAARSLGRLRGG